MTNNKTSSSLKTSAMNPTSTKSGSSKKTMSAGGGGWSSVDAIGIIDTFFQFQLELKMYHWMTRVYSRHIASDQLTEKLLAIVDRFVEVYIGHYGRPKQETMNMTLDIRIKTDEEMIERLNSFSQTVSAWRDLPGDLTTIRDDLIEAVHQTLYLFSLS